MKSLFGGKNRKNGAKGKKGKAAQGPESAHPSPGAQNGKGDGMGNKGNQGQSVDGSSTVFRVKIPEGVQPGEEFQVYAGDKIVRVKCPPNSRPGQFLQITVPIDPGAAPSLPDSSAGNIPNSPGVQKVAGNAYMVPIPEGVRPGQQFPVVIEGRQLMVTSPPNGVPGSMVRIVPPPPGPSDGGSSLSLPPPDSSPSPAKAPKEDEETQLFEVQVPNGVKPNQSFALLAAGVRVLVTCPGDAGPGQRIRFKLPKALTAKRKPHNEAMEIKLSYDKDGWTRTIRVSDMKFQWVRMDDNGDIDTNTRFEADKSAYVRKLSFLPPQQGADDRIRDGKMSLVPASKAFVDSRVKGNTGEVIVSYSEIADAQVKNFEDKALWFQDKCKLLRVEWNEGHMRINVRREHLLEDSVDAVMSLNRRDLRKVWRFEFIGEVGIDAGGLAREWFELVTKAIFDPDMGLWQSSEANQMCMQINPASREYIQKPGSYTLVIALCLSHPVSIVRRLYLR